MGLWNDPVDTIVNRLRDTLVFSDTGNHVSNYALDLLNRAQNWLSMNRQWDFLKKTATITLDSNRQAVLPSDLNSILAIYVDVSGIGKPTVYYNVESNDVSKRYEIFDTFSVDTGHVKTITFPSNAPVLGTLILLYTYNLPNIEAGQTYTFFPSELLFRCAQKIHHEDKGTTGDSIEYTIKAFNELMDSFIRNSQYNNQNMDQTINDKYGNPLKIGGHLLGGYPSSKTFSPYQNSTFLT